MNPLQAYYDRIAKAVPEAVVILVECSMSLWKNGEPAKYSCGIHFHNAAGGRDLSQLKRREFWDQRAGRRIDIYASKEAFRINVSGNDLDTVCCVAIEAYQNYLAAGRDIDEDRDGITSDGRSMKALKKDFDERKPFSLKTKGERYKVIHSDWNTEKEKERCIVLPSERPVLRIETPLNEVGLPSALTETICDAKKIGKPQFTDENRLVWMNVSEILDGKRPEKDDDPHHD